MIVNASDTLLSQNPGTLPNVSGAMLDWFQTLSFILISKRVVNFQLVETTNEITAQAVRQPMNPQRVSQKPEGQRAWRWETLHTLPDLILSVDDQIIFNSIKYRVMARKDWREYGYLEFEITQDYTP